MESQPAFSHCNSFSHSTLAQDPFASEVGFAFSASSNQQRGINEILASISQYGYRTPMQDMPAPKNQCELQTSDYSQPTIEMNDSDGRDNPSINLSGNAHSLCFSNPSFESRPTPCMAKPNSTDIEIHQILSETELEKYRSQNPLPIQATYEVASDFFDLHTLDDRLDWVAKQADQLAAIVAIPASQLNSVENSQTSLQTTNVRQTNERIEVDESDGKMFWVSANGQVIEIDGRDGFDYIDLAYFDLSQASFEGDCIKLQLPDHGTFQVQYRNIAYAIFADYQRVDLAVEIADCDVQENS